MNFPHVGKAAPSFSLKNQDDKKVSLKDLKGKTVILYFYPKAMTPGCTVQACGIRDSKSQLKKANVEVFGISPDAPERLAKFIEKEKLNFNLLSDPDHELATKYGVYGKKKFMGREYMGIHRVTFIIDKTGKLAHVMEKVNTKTHHKDVMDYVEENLLA